MADRLLRIPEAADLLALSRPTIHRMIAAGTLRVVRPTGQAAGVKGAAVRIPLSEVTKLMDPHPGEMARTA